MAKTDLTNQRQVFVEEYVRSGDHLEAAKKAGYKDTHTLRNQACKLRRECAEEITEELHRNFAEIAPRALNILTDLAENVESESVRLGATRDLLDRAGFRPVDRHEIVKEKSVEELNAHHVLGDKLLILLQCAWLITQRSKVQILPPPPIKSTTYRNNNYLQKNLVSI